LDRPVDLDRGIATANFDPDSWRFRRRGRKRHRHEGGRHFRRRARASVAPRRRFDTALTHPAADLIGIDAIGHRDSGNRGARLATRRNHRLLELFRVMPPAPIGFCISIDRVHHVFSGHDLPGLKRLNS
jgi:hypothetical protein